MLGEYFRSGQIGRLVREAVVLRLLVDEDLMIEAKSALRREQASRKDVSAIRLDPYEQVAPTDRTEATFGPLRRVIYRYLVLALEAQVITAAQCEQRTTTPISTDVAVAGAGIRAQLSRV